MTIDAFCKKTGWPLEEFMALPVTEAIEIGLLYGYRLAVMEKRNKRLREIASAACLFPAEFFRG